MDTLNRSLNSQFENLANETIYELFEYLDTYDVYQAFMDLNSRFRNLLMSSSLPLKINMKYLSKPNVQSYYTRFIFPNLHRIDFLHLWNPFLIHLDCPSIRHLQNSLELKTLVLDNVLSENVLPHLRMLLNLHSLIINRTVSNATQHINFQPIVRLPVLKYCKISYPGEILLECPDDHIKNKSPIEHLVINGVLIFEDFLPILSYLPYLSRLSIDRLANMCPLIRKPITQVFDNLTHVCLNLKNITFDQFELLVTLILKNVEVLCISTNTDHEYLNARRWEQLILSSMIHLRIFDIQCIYNVRDELDRSRCKELMKQFTSSFWTERQWYFSQQHSTGVHGDKKMFYSIQPYRRRSYTLVGTDEQYNTESPLDNNMNTVRHVHVQSQRAMDDCSLYFANARELTIGNNSFIFHDSIIKTFNRILPFQQLDHIIIDYRTFGFRRLLELLQFAPNCSKLIIYLIEVDDNEEQQDFEFTQTNEIVQYVSPTNRIKDLTIRSICNFNAVQLLFKYFSRLQHLTIKVKEWELKSVLKFLLSKTNENTRNLILLNIDTTANRWIEKVINQLELTDETDHFSIREINERKSCIWW